MKPPNGKTQTSRDREPYSYPETFWLWQQLKFFSKNSFVKYFNNLKRRLAEHCILPNIMDLTNYKVYLLHCQHLNMLKSPSSIKIKQIKNIKCTNHISYFFLLPSLPSSPQPTSNPLYALSSYSYFISL